MMREEAEILQISTFNLYYNLLLLTSVSVYVRVVCECVSRIFSRT